MKIENGKYLIRSMAFDEYLYMEQNHGLVVNPKGKCTDIFDVVCKEDKVKISFYLIPFFYLRYENGVLEMSKGTKDKIFRLIENDNGSFCLKSRNGLYVTVNSDRRLYLGKYMPNSSYQQFCFDRVGKGYITEVSGYGFLIGNLDTSKMSY